MSKVTESPTTESRKVDHIRINLEQDVQFPRLTTGLEVLRFVHQALPELSLRQVDTATTVFGKRLSAPILISSMTGGTELARGINRNLARAAQEQRIAMGLGSQRAAIEDAALEASYAIRDVAPDILLFANIGAVQLNYGYGLTQCQRAVDMVGADALILHFNALQEAVQAEGDIDFSGLLRQVETVCKKLPVPVIAKEVGWGFSRSAARSLADAGVAAIDVAGAGGTSWSEVEYHRAPSAFHARVARSFADWGIPTADAIFYARSGAPDLPIFASGGLRDGIDIAKCLALGADMAGLASPFLRAASESAAAVSQLIHELTAQLRIAMFCSASRDINSLRGAELLPAGSPPQTRG
ncbi:MAG: type 2 isopentenyl-diphosphate Delta-isomerase [Chloroflexi bacterium]|nr:type 2 isopentenyl-diphosphate Delta-isomerase [Chloroflexota bacterium]MCY3583843.1 type 2 isopentenyl-diphosphate Delta-isomerase [Chloroflexota bacterium]MCY3716225.1 type 2 isopentenyl-diphosphate Delta-isomerase [Chloroflexota bacterium]MDE2650446.1 type 2 isopentenyl-diphosphate Delta-isomerase [Chloroflexota bacterium]MXV93195.1 type 2 isopentenyl-diphosphate Delta-isomerase [Chloroflexota bacterium]